MKTFSSALTAVLAIIALLTVSVMFTACDTNTPTGSDTTTATAATEAPTTVPTEPPVPEKQLTMVVEHQDYGDKIYEFQYDEQNRLQTLLSDAYVGPKVFTYDAYGNLLSSIIGEPTDTLIQGENTGVEYEYNSENQLIREYRSEGSGGETLHEYDESGRRSRSFESGEKYNIASTYVYEGDGLAPVSKNISYEPSEYSFRLPDDDVVYYSYEEYKPFVVTTSTTDYGEEEYTSIKVQWLDKASVPLFEFTVSAPTFETDEDGYLVKVIDDKSTYEFYYDGETP